MIGLEIAAGFKKILFVDPSEEMIRIVD
nr:hypothetical protein [Enterococcus sp. 12C11_DIV0727]